MNINLDLATIVSGLAVLGLGAVAKLVFNTVLLQREMHAEFKAHEKLDDTYHRRVEELERRVA